MKLIKLILVLLVFTILNQHSVYAATLRFSTDTVSIKQNTEFVVSVLIDTQSVNTNAAAVNVQFDSNYIKPLSIDSTTSAYSIGATETIGSTTVVVERGSISAVNSANALLTKVRFRALTPIASTTISFTTGSAVISSQDASDVLSSTQSLQLSISSASVPAPSPPSTSPNASPASQAQNPSSGGSSSVLQNQNNGQPATSSEGSFLPSDQTASQAVPEPVNEQADQIKIDNQDTRIESLEITNQNKEVVKNEVRAQDSNIEEAYIVAFICIIALVLIWTLYVRRNVSLIKQIDVFSHLKKRILKGYDPSGKTISEIEADLRIKKIN